MRIPLTPSVLQAIAAYTAEVIRAREEYRRHPFSKADHAYGCAREGCPQGRRRARQQAINARNYWRRRHGWTPPPD